MGWLYSSLDLWNMMAQEEKKNQLFFSKFIPLVTTKYKRLPKIFLVPRMLTVFDSLRELLLFWKLRIAKFYYFCLFDRLWKMSLIFCTFTYKWVSFRFFVSKYWQKVLLLPCFFCRDKICFNVEQLTLAFLKMFCWYDSAFQFFEIAVISFDCDYFLFFFFSLLMFVTSTFSRTAFISWVFIYAVTIHSLTAAETAKIHNTSPAGNYMFKVNNRNTRTRCEICWKLTIKTPERWCLYC